MDLAAQYAALMAPPEARILRRRLLPFTVGHAKLLPALGLDRVENLAELLAALWVCSQPAPTAWRRLKQRLWRWQTYLWGVYIGITGALDKDGREGLFLKARAQWAEYQAFYWRIPDMVPTREPSGGIAPPGGPLLAHVEHVLGAECGLTPAQIQELPLNEAFWRYAIALEAAGTLTLQDTNELSAEEYALARADADANHEAWLQAANATRVPFN
jgi:hypothetical protein